MKKSILSLFVLGLAASIEATPIVFQDIYDPQDKKLSAGGSNSSLTFTHNILDNGFLPSNHTIQSAKLSLSLSDDGDRDRFSFIFPIDHEFATVKADGDFLAPWLFEVDGGTRQFTVSSALLQYDGKLQVTLKAVSGDFYFNSSRLDVEAVAAVPEPGTMALTGLGLLAMGLAVRRRKQA